MTLTTAFLSPKEAAAQIGIHRNTLDAQIKAGNIAVRRLGSRVGISADEIGRVQQEGLPPVKWPARPRKCLVTAIEEAKNNKPEPDQPAAAPLIKQQSGSREKTEPEVVTLQNHKLYALHDKSAPTSPIWRGIDIAKCSEAQWRRVTGLSLLPPTLRGRLGYIAGTDPAKPKLAKPATPEELIALTDSFEQYGVRVPVGAN